jgi:hypothetical protein
METRGPSATSVRVWDGARVQLLRLRRPAPAPTIRDFNCIKHLCETAVVLSLQLAKVMHLPEFTAVGRLGFARWNKGQHGSDSGAAQRLSPGVLRPPPKLEMGAQPEHQNIHHGPAQRRSLQRRQPARRIINMHSKPLVGQETLLRWRQPARLSMPATRQARAHAQWHGNNTRPTRLGCTPRRPLHPQHHSLRPPGRPNNAQCLSLQRRQPA